MTTIRAILENQNLDRMALQVLSVARKKVVLQVKPSDYSKQSD